MNFLDINTYLPLSDSEFMYKEIYLEYPNFAFNEPKTVKHISSLLDSLIDYKNKYHLDCSYRPSMEFMQEDIIPNPYDAIITRPLRYSPCFIHTHSFFEVIYVLNGFCINNISNRSIKMKKGDFCILAPGTTHSVSVFNDECIIFNILIKSSTFERAFFGNLVNNDILSSFFSLALYAPSSEAYLLFPTRNDLYIQNLILELYSEFQANLPYSERMLNTIITKLFIILLRNHGKNVIVPNPSGNNVEKKIIKIMSYIFTNYKTITLKELANFFNYSERQMFRILKDYNGKSFINIIQDIKVQKACELLRNSDISISNIIEAVGYSNTSYFYRIFKKKYDMTPVEYRNK